MDKRILGTDLEVSAVGLGCMGFSHAYGAPTDDAEAIRNIRKAYDLGYTMFDTAEIYGTAEDPHRNEVLVGEALKEIRNKVQIITKFGIHFDYNSNQVNKPLVTDARPEVIRKSVEGSLKRLQTDHIDLYFQHRIDANTEPETVAEVMAELIKEGKILHWGISEANEEYLRRADKVCKVTAVENRYSMMARQYETLFPVLEELNVGLIAFSPMANGLLTGRYNKDSTFDKQLDYRSNMPQFKPEAYDQNQKLLQMLNDMAIKHQETPAQISMAWMLCKKPWIVPIPGTRKISRMEENAARLAEEVLKGKDYKTLNLADYKVYSYGQEFPDDQFEEVLSQMKEADVIVIGSPLYWHNICGAVRNLLDRFYGPVAYNSFSGKKLAFLFQGAAPEKWMLEAGEYTMSRYAGLYGMKYVGMATNIREAKALSERI